jgi:hypothetical protein
MLNCYFLGFNALLLMNVKELIEAEISRHLSGVG